MLAVVENPTPQTAQFAMILLWSLTVACLIGWCVILLRQRRGRTLFRTESPGEVPWGLSDVLIIAGIWMASMIATRYSIQRFISSEPDDEINSVATPMLEEPMAGDPSPAVELPEISELTSQPAFFLISTVFSLAACAVALLYLRSRYGAAVGIHLGLNRWPHRLTEGAIGFVLAMPPVIWLMTFLVRMSEYEHTTLTALAQSPTWAVIVAAWLSAGIVAPLAEEFFFRFVLQAWLSRFRIRDNMAHRLNVLYGDNFNPFESPSKTDLATRARLPMARLPIGAIVIASTIFSLAHLGQGPAPIALFVYSIAMGYVYYRSGSIIPPIVMHLLLNFYSLTLATMASLELAR